MSQENARVHEEGQNIMTREQLLQRLERAWQEFQASSAGLSDAKIIQPGVVENWSVKDILAHVTTWEEEALKYLPLIVTGRKPPRYATTYGGLDAFNAQMAGRKRDLPLAEVRRQLDDTHRRLLDYIATVPEEQFTRETPFRHRLRLDTYSHYPIHTRSILEWRAQRAM
jgi:hypothetical protein